MMLYLSSAPFKLSKELKKKKKIASKSIKAMRFLSYWSKHQVDCLIHNLKTTGSTRISMPFLSSLDNLL